MLPTVSCLPEGVSKKERNLILRYLVFGKVGKEMAKKILFSPLFLLQCNYKESQNCNPYLPFHPMLLNNSL